MKAVTSTNGSIVCGERVRVEYLPTEDKKAFHSRISTNESREGGNKHYSHDRRHRSPPLPPPPRTPPRSPQPHHRLPHRSRSPPPRHHSPRRSPPSFQRTPHSPRRTPPFHRTLPPSRHTPSSHRHTLPPSRRTPPSSHRQTPPPPRRTPPRRTPPPPHYKTSPNYHHRGRSPHNEYHSHHPVSSKDRHSHHYTSSSRSTYSNSYLRHDSYHRSPPLPTHHEYSKRQRSYASSSSSHDYRSEPSYGGSGRSEVYLERKDDFYDDHYPRSSKEMSRDSYNNYKYKQERPSSRRGRTRHHSLTPLPTSRSRRNLSPSQYSSQRVPSHPLSPPNRLRENDLDYRNQRPNRKNSSTAKGFLMENSNYHDNKQRQSQSTHRSSLPLSRSQRKNTQRHSRQDQGSNESATGRSRSPLPRSSPQYTNTLSGEPDDYILYNDDQQYSSHSPHTQPDNNVKLNDAHFGQEEYKQGRGKSSPSPLPDYVPEGESIQVATNNDNFSEQPYNPLPPDEGNFEFSQGPEAFALETQFLQLEELKGDSTHQEEPSGEEMSTFYCEREITFSPRMEREVIRVSTEREVIHVSRSPSTPPRRDRSRSGTPTLMD